MTGPDVEAAPGPEASFELPDGRFLGHFQVIDGFRPEVLAGLLRIWEAPRTDAARAP